MTVCGDYYKKVDCCRLHSLSPIKMGGQGKTSFAHIPSECRLMRNETSLIRQTTPSTSGGRILVCESMFSTVSHAVFAPFTLYVPT